MLFWSIETAEHAQEKIMNDDQLTAEQVIQELGLEPHPEGGYYREEFRSDAENGERGAATSIYFLLKKGEVSRWHAVDAVELYHHYAGAPLELNISNDGEALHTIILGTGLAADQRPLGMVPPHAWQSARSLGDWTLVGCTVAPAFEFAGFEMAPEGWSPGGGP